MEGIIISLMILGIGAIVAIIVSSVEHSNSNTMGKKGLPKTILAVVHDFHEKEVYTILYLHEPSDKDKFTEHRYFYYDETGEEVCMSDITAWVDVMDVSFKPTIMLKAD